MTYNYQPIVDIFSAIMLKVQAEYDTANQEEPYFMYGHPLELVNILAEKTQSSTYKFKKYPVVMLFQDFTEKVGLADRNVPINIVIATSTKATYLAPARYTNTFKPILYPIWDLLIKHMKRSSSINQTQFEYDKTDRLYWGRNGLYGNEGNILGDFVDAIEIENMNLSITETC